MNLVKEAPSPTAQAGGGRRGRVRNTIAAGALALMASGAVAVMASPAAQAAAGPCYSGHDGSSNTWAWGSCTSVNGGTKWRLHVSCTWGDTQTSSWFSGAGRTDVQCPWPETIRGTGIDTWG